MLQKGVCSGKDLKQFVGGIRFLREAKLLLNVPVQWYCMAMKAGH